MLKMLISAFLIVVAHSAFGQEVPSSPPCETPAYKNIISSTQSKIVSKAVFNVPKDFFNQSTRYACVLMLFDISKTGSPQNISAVLWFPNKSLVSSARKALEKYKFAVDAQGENTKSAVVFVAKLPENKIPYLHYPNPWE